MFKPSYKQHYIINNVSATSSANGTVMDLYTTRNS